MIIVSVVYQKRLKKEKRMRKQVQDQLDVEIKRRTKLEDALKATGATPEQVRSITGNIFSISTPNCSLFFIQVEEKFVRNKG